MSETLVQVENVSKKFCRSLKKSLWYGVKDVAGALNPFSRDDDSASQSPELRPDEFWAVRDVSFELKRGECLGLIGHNGAGKSTLLKVINGLIPPDTGRITMRGRVAALIELNAGFNPILSGRENIYNRGAILGFSKKEIEAKFDEIVDFAEIGEFIDMPVQNYSSGMLVRLGFAVSTQIEPDILILDEVMAVGDVAFQMKCINRLTHLVSRSAVIFVSHSMPHVGLLCSKVIVLSGGKPLWAGDKIETGINHYLMLAETEKRQVLLSDLISIKSISLGKSGSESETVSTLEISYGEDIYINCDLAFEAPIQDVAIQFLIWSIDIRAVINVLTSELAPYSIEPQPEGRVRVSAKIEKIDLNGGRYTVSAIVSSADLKTVYCRQDNAAVIIMRSETPSGALTLDKATWTTIKIKL